MGSGFLLFRVTMNIQKGRFCHHMWRWGYDHACVLRKQAYTCIICYVNEVFAPSSVEILA